MYSTNPQLGAEPSEATLAEWLFEENLHRTHGVKPEVLPGFGKHRKPSIMAVNEQEEQDAA